MKTRRNESLNQTVAIASIKSNSRGDAIYKATCGGSNAAVERALRKLAKELGVKLQELNPHVHCIVPALALRACNPLGASAGHHPESEIIRPNKDGFLIHYRPLSIRFRCLFHSTLKDQYPEIYQTLTPQQRHSLSPKKQWNVQLQHVGKGKTALRYLARYVCRSGFTNKRLIGYDKTGKNVLLKWTPSGTKEIRVLRLSIDEFIRRWLQHVLPKGFLRIRHYGYLSSAAKKSRLKIWSQLGALEPLATLPEKEPFTCPHCEGELKYLCEIPRPQRTRAP